MQFQAVITTIGRGDSESMLGVLQDVISRGRLLGKSGRRTCCTFLSRRFILRLSLFHVASILFSSDCFRIQCTGRILDLSVD